MLKTDDIRSMTMPIACKGCSLDNDTRIEWNELPAVEDTDFRAAHRPDRSETASTSTRGCERRYSGCLDADCC